MKEGEKQFGFNRFEMFKFLADFLYLHKLISVYELSFMKKTKRRIIIESTEEKTNPMRTGVGAFGTEGNANFFVSNMMDIIQA
jgi:hypothetical protein